VKVSLHTAQALIRPPPTAEACEAARGTAVKLYHLAILECCRKALLLHGAAALDASTDWRRSSFAFSECIGSASFLAISDQTDVGISSALHAGLGFFGLPNAALVTRLAVRSARSRGPGAGVSSLSMFCHVHGMI
jgi:hypothetical protein